MSRARVARRIATAAAYGGGGIGLLGGAAFGLLFTEVRLAKRKLGRSEDIPPLADGLYGTAFARRADPGPGPPSGAPATEGAEPAAPAPPPPLRLAFLGDSTAAGQGVHRAGQTPGALLASGLAAVAERPVRLTNVALSGATSEDLERQVTMVLGDTGPAGAHPATDGPFRGAPDVCVVIVGANDVTRRMPPARSVRLLSEAVARLRGTGSAVVVGTCPDLGSVEPVAQPLRWIARRLSRQLAAAQTIAVVERGGRTVSLGDLLGPEFTANPRELFGPDQYHPSAEGYATAAMAILPTLCAALGLWPEGERPDVSRRESVLPVARAAVEAVEESGTEVAAAAGGGTRTPWALLKHRRRRRLAATGEDEPEREEAPGPEQALRKCGPDHSAPDVTRSTTAE